MAHLAPRLDLDMAGKLVANFLQSWLQAGLDQEPQAPQSLHDSQDVPRHDFSWERGRFSGALFRGKWRVGYGII